MRHSSTAGKGYRIGEVEKMTGLSADTLRYYEKIKLLVNVSRSAAGIRMYDDRDISRLRFIQRSKAMNFSLQEIARLLEMRDDPQHVRNEIRELTWQKLAQIETHIQTMQSLRNELTLLVNLCRSSEEGCPIIRQLNEE
ncbi:MAG: heavy metal-responsive transcriptional regulator [gamma proteobacterium symbiont of Bathyaustriella thionipta]|nr:heavy metal-responsive transcriptional regulator [gamma proteobacterium symbiont of Bathyaustriella thionipta]